MIPAIAQAVANILVAGTSLSGTEQIDFGYPGVGNGCKPCLNLYLYEIREIQSSTLQPQLSYLGDDSINSRSLHWFNFVFVLMVQDHTTLGEQHLLSESLLLLLQHPQVPLQFLPPTLQKYGTLPLSVSPMSLTDQAGFWHAIGIPLRPALQIIVSTPFETQTLHHSNPVEPILPHAPP